ncbi:zinc finger transcription factor YY1-like isoform X2 [Typha latifolia]|uniref:zinc finger transcription factor YY1-like isoform X2 n=1 Tax=Typha latifolia TaxID=4733 RepID=UPI003C304BC5
MDDRNPAVRWVKKWVPKGLATAGGKCPTLKWVKDPIVLSSYLCIEDMSENSREKSKEPEAEEQEPEPATEILFLCSYEGCGTAFLDARALRKHVQIHCARQHFCHFEGCGKKFADSSKLKRHFLVHTGERNFRCPHEGCTKAFSLDFNLKAHMRTHSLENYHLCPYAECGKRYTQECKLKAHIRTHHERNGATDAAKHAAAGREAYGIRRIPAARDGSALPDRPYACPYQGCKKAYIHEYKLNLHLRKEHPGHSAEGNGKVVDEGSHQNGNLVMRGIAKNSKRCKTSLVRKTPSAKIARTEGSKIPPPTIDTVKQQWLNKEMHEEHQQEGMEDDEEDSEETETEDERENVEGLREVNNEDDDIEEDR